jgi:ribosomal protein L37AE/L43A
MGNKPSMRVGVTDSGFCPYCQRYNMPLKPTRKGFYRCLKCGNEVTGKATGRKGSEERA